LSGGTTGYVTASVILRWLEIGIFKPRAALGLKKAVFRLKSSPLAKGIAKATAFGLFLTIAAIDSSPQPTKSEKIFSYIKVGLPTTTGLVQQPVQIVVRYRSHNLTLFVRFMVYKSG
jgi:hypothetical protein